MPDIDIDFADRDHALKFIKHIPAAIKDTNGSFKKHNTGIYCTPIPYNPVNNLSNVDYKEAEERGYFKLDFLNVSIYLADQIRLAAKQGDRRFLYVIHMGKIASAKSFWRWVKYRGLNPHKKHIHISFKPNQNGKPFNIPLLGGTDETIKKA